MSQPSVCFIGLGIQGAPIAGRLLAEGFAVSGWNRSPEKAAWLVAEGLRLAADPRAAAAGADIVALCLTDEAAVEAVLFGEPDLAAAIGPGAIVLDFSTIGSAATVRLGERLRAERGAAWVDAPVSGGPSGARAGTLAIFCGGAAEDVARVAPVLAAVSRVTTHMGPAGCGQATKLCNQLIVSAAIMAVAEAVTLAGALGLDAGKLPAALAGGYADSRPLQIFGPRMAGGALEPRISEVATMLKDLRLVHAAAAGQPVALTMSRAVLGLYERALADGLGGEDLGVLPRLSAAARADG